MNTSKTLPFGKLLSAICLCLVTLQGLAQAKKILIVSTNIDTVGTSRSGTFLMEIAYPFNYFTSQGYDVDIVTPKGGKASIYQRAKEAEDLNVIQNSALFVSKISATLRPEGVDAKLYAAVFYPGGHGQYFDVVNDERIAKLTSVIYERGGVVGTAGHGAASLINVQLSNGAYFVTGKSMTCFPQWAEKKFMNISNYGKLLAFDMQEVLARRGANLSVSTFETYGNKEINQVVDVPNRLVTGAFAGSAQWVAEQMAVLMKGSKSN